MGAGLWADTGRLLGNLLEVSNSGISHDLEHLLPPFLRVVVLVIVMRATPDYGVLYHMSHMWIGLFGVDVAVFELTITLDHPAGEFTLIPVSCQRGPPCFSVTTNNGGASRTTFPHRGAIAHRGLTGFEAGLFHFGLGTKQTGH